MIQCNQFSDTVQPPRFRWVGNRVTFSELTSCEIEKYTASTYSIKYVLSGTEHYFTNNKKYSVSAGNFLLVNKQQPVDIYIRSQKKVVGFCIHFEDDLMRDAYRQLMQNGGQLLDDPFCAAAVPELEQIIYAEKENRPGQLLAQLSTQYDRASGCLRVDPHAFFHGLSQQLFLLQKGAPAGARNLAAEKHSTKMELIRRLEIAKEMMHVGEPLSLNMESIAQTAMLSSSHFFRSFKKLYGITPYQFVLQQKIERSATLLRKRNTSITDVAFENGFADVASFSKAFRRQYGCSPSQFLQSC